MAGQVVDTLITRYELDSKNYDEGAKKVLAATTSLDGAITAVKGNLIKLAASAGPAGVALVGVFGAAAGVLGLEVELAKQTWEIGKNAVVAAVNFDAMGTTIGAALGDLEKGRQVMAGLSDYAKESAFQLKDLAKSATVFASGGMDIGRWLKVAEGIALVMNGGTPDPGALQSVTGALLRSKGGGFGEAMEIFRRAGISSTDFNKAGVQISAGGQVNATPEKFLDALEKIFMGRPKRIVDELMKSDAVALSNFGDAIDITQRSFGDALRGEAMGALRAFSASIFEFTSNGGMTALAESVKGWVSSIVDAEKLDFGGIVNRAAAGIMTMYDAAVVGVAALRGFADGLTSVVKMMDTIHKIGTPGRWLEKESPFKGGFSVSDTFEGHLNELEMQAAIYKKKSAKSKKVSTADALHTPEEKGKAGTIEPVLHKIEENTRNTKDLMKRLMFGHGAGMGVNPISMSSHAKRASTRHGQDLGMLLSGIIDERVFQAMTEARGMA